MKTIRYNTPLGLMARTKRRSRRNREPQDELVNWAYAKFGFGMNKALFGLLFYLATFSVLTAFFLLIINQ